eukprot:5667879-Pleurochrysis_carterae.AAC.1
MARAERRTPIPACEVAKSLLATTQRASGDARTEVAELSTTHRSCDHTTGFYLRYFKFFPLLCVPSFAGGECVGDPRRALDARMSIDLSREAPLRTRRTCCGAALPSPPIRHRASASACSVDDRPVPSSRQKVPQNLTDRGIDSETKGRKLTSRARLRARALKRATAAVLQHLALPSFTTTLAA